MNIEKAEKAKSQLAPYGYTLTDSMQIQKGDKIFSAVVSAKGPRFYVKMLSGAPLWSGPDLGEFVRSFWYAKKITEHQPNMSSSHRLRRIQTCAKCSHHKSAHVYDPSKPRSGPQRCTVPGCHCHEFRQPQEGERIRRDLAHNGTTWGKHGESEDDYVLGIVDRDANIGLYRVGRSGLIGPLKTSASLDTIISFMERDADDLGIHGSAVFQQNDDGSWTQVGNIARGRYQESGGYRGNSSSVPAPRFKAGDRVERDDGSARGEVAMVGSYDDFLGCYRYKVQQDGGGRIWWNETSTRHEGHTRNGRATVVDPVAARELDLYIANTYELVGAPTSIGKSIDTNLKRKLSSGKYNPALAPAAWLHLVDEGSKRYQKEFGSDSPIFNAATRRQVAADFARAWEEENGL